MMLTRLVGVMGLLGLPAVAGALVTGCGPGPVARGTLHAVATHVEGTGIVDVQTRNGSVVVMADRDATDVEISAKVHTGGGTRAEAEQRLADTEIEARLGDDGVFRVSIGFPAPVQRLDSASITVRLPAADGARITTSNGAVIVRGLGGTLDASTSNGNVSVQDHDGDVEIRTSNGSVTVTGVTGRATVHASNGSVVVRLGPESAGPIDLRTSNGNVAATVGPAFAGEVSMETSNGRVSVRDDAGVLGTRELAPTRGRVVAGEGGAASRLRSSNGSVQLVIEAP